jgi:hypothetical protein
VIFTIFEYFSLTVWSHCCRPTQHPRLWLTIVSGNFSHEEIYMYILKTKVINKTESSLKVFSGKIIEKQGKYFYIFLNKNIRYIVVFRELQYFILKSAIF